MVPTPAVSSRCNEGEDFSQEKLAELTWWNTVIDGLDAPATTPIRLYSEGHAEIGYDGLWVLRWNSKSDDAAG